MKVLTASSILSVLLIFGGATACSRPAAKSPDVSAAVRQSLDQAGLKDVSVNQDRDKGVVTLSGHVVSDDAKNQAASLAQSASAGQVVANQIAVLPPGDEKISKTVGSDLDKGIEKNLDAALTANRLTHLTYDVKNQVVVLKGEVNSQASRSDAAQVASQVPNVAQVVNEVQVKDQKATSN